MSVTLSDLKKDFASQSKPLRNTEKGHVKGHIKPSMPAPYFKGKEKHYPVLNVTASVEPKKYVE